MFKEFVEARSNFEPIETGALFEEFRAWCIGNGRENPYRTQRDFGAQFKESIVGLGQRRSGSGPREWVFPSEIVFSEAPVNWTADVMAFMREYGVKATDGDHYAILGAFTAWLGDRKPPQKAVFYALLRNIYGAKQTFSPSLGPASAWKWHFPHWDEEKGAVPIGAFINTDKDAEIARLKAEITALKNEIAALKGERA